MKGITCGVTRLVSFPGQVRCGFGSLAEFSSNSSGNPVYSWMQSTGTVVGDGVHYSLDGVNIEKLLMLTILLDMYSIKYNSPGKTK